MHLSKIIKQQYLKDVLFQIEKCMDTPNFRFGYEELTSKQNPQETRVSAMRRTCTQ